MNLRLSLLCVILVICFVYTSAQSNGRTRGFSRIQSRPKRLSEFLTPPAPPSTLRNRPQANNPFFRHGKGLSPPPAASLEPPGFFQTFMSWFNPFSRTPSAPPVAPRPQVHPDSSNLQSGLLQPPPPSSNGHGPPPVSQTGQYIPPCRPENHQLPQPPSPSTGPAYLPPSGGKDCVSCNQMPWVPINQAQIDNSGHHQDASQDYPVAAPPQEVRPSDFGYGVPKDVNPQLLNLPQTHYPSPITGPIPNPHLYPGAMPPLYKAQPFDSQAAYSDVQTTSDVAPTTYNVPEGSVFNQGNPVNNPRLSAAGSASVDSQSYVDVLPSGAEVLDHDHYSPTSPEVTLDNGGSSSDLKHILHSSEEHEAASASLNPVVQTAQPVPDSSVQDNIFGTKLSADGKHIIHVEQSPVIDLTGDDKKSKDSSSSTSSSSSVKGAPVILQNADGTFGINVTWSHGESSITSAPFKSRADDTTSAIEEDQSTPVPQNVTSLLVQVLDSTSDLSDEIKTTQQPYGSYSENVGETTTQGPILDSITKPKNVQNDGTRIQTARGWYDPQIQRGSGFVPSLDAIPRRESLPRTQSQGSTSRPIEKQPGVKRNKQVQIIIPYTSQYTPSSFHPSRDGWSQEDQIKNQGRKVSSDGTQGDNYDELSHVYHALTDLSEAIETSTTFNVKANTSIDVLRLQKNIDNWTIQEYSEGTTASPSSSHPQLLQSKKIPDEYFTTTEPVPIAETIREAERSFGNVLAGFSVNELEHEGSASSRVDVSHVPVSLSNRDDSLESQEDLTTTSTLAPSSSEDLSWEQLPFSISPLSHERVYVVTPQPMAKPTTFNSNTKDKKKSKSVKKLSTNSTSQFESIERAYQVLPEAVNNLAVASTGPATVPLWGIMEHEEYASPSTQSINTSAKPILYSGHSKVSRTRQ